MRDSLVIEQVAAHPPGWPWIATDRSSPSCCRGSGWRLPSGMGEDRNNNVNITVTGGGQPPGWPRIATSALRRQPRSLPSCAAAALRVGRGLQPLHLLVLAAEHVGSRPLSGIAEDRNYHSESAAPDRAGRTPAPAGRRRHASQDRRASRPGWSRRPARRPARRLWPVVPDCGRSPPGVVDVGSGRAGSPTGRCGGLPVTGCLRPAALRAVRRTGPAGPSAGT
jgi:hypothetical protein